MNDEHIIPNDDFQHIEDFACDCHPNLTNFEGRLVYIHNEIHKDETEATERV